MAAPKTGSPVVIIFCGPDVRRYLVAPYLVTGKCGGDFDGLVGRVRPRSAHTTVTQDLCAALRRSCRTSGMLAAGVAGGVGPVINR